MDERVAGETALTELPLLTDELLAAEELLETDELLETEELLGMGAAAPRETTPEEERLTPGWAAHL